MIAASMRISVVTPSRNMLGYLRRAAASVVDQEGVDAEHVVMDACSTDGTREWLATHFPERAAKVMGIVRETRGGRDNDPDFFSRFRPSGTWAQLFRDRFRIARRRFGIANERMELDCSHFRPPALDGQLQLL